MMVVILPVFRNFPLLSVALVVVVILMKYPQDYQQFRTTHLVAVREGVLTELWKDVEVVSQGVCLPLVVVVVIWWVVEEEGRDWIVPEARILLLVLVQLVKAQLKKSLDAVKY